ncbi:hypothetical protein DL991_09285 [Amycolatopsis sp. WAC 01375]|uniref:hypothetical protein n=2 Tax=unclassified Amycolatopsis TaxID=2618356 RepID=UPI000F7B4BBB|nr:MULTISPECIES: hypothetical protein [unclassified Amycolatopsis]RSM56004.1 hypothetical protein DMH03_31245 [Amycolatopsis sp. WAC 01376]RSM81132.1 hypothetical protein DL991_09285 [Amycolatopsis sp. WAC 01375]RSN20651.1 hypothetical protein DL990_39715 [Amycolatopsis sp. WAC 01416]
MATMDITEGGVRVRFSGWERLAVWRDEVVVPRAAIKVVEHVDAPLRRTRGGRVGALISGVLKVGYWGLGTGIRQLVSVRRGVPGLRIEIDRGVAGLSFDEVLVSVPNAAELADALAPSNA